MLRRAPVALLGVLLAAIFAGCGTGKGKVAAEKAVADFHQRLDRSDFGRIYASAGSDLKNASTEKDFVELLDAVHRKLGSVQSAQLAGWRSGTFNRESRVSLSYKTTFTGGVAQENFDYRIDGPKASLIGYHINSNVLIVK